MVAVEAGAERESGAGTSPESIFYYIYIKSIFFPSISILGDMFRTGADKVANRAFNVLG